MGYATIRIERIKTSHEMNSRYKHNFREYDVANADWTRTSQNIEVKDMNGKTYEQVANSELSRMRINGYQGKKIRKDAIRGLEILLSFSQEDKDNVPIDKWIEKNVEWLEKNFNPKDNKIIIMDENNNENIVHSDNVKSIVVHLDEAVPHIHAFVVPINSKGSLNAHDYIGSRKQLQDIQTSYAEAMQEFGLKRGTRGQKTPHQNVSKYYEELNKAVTDTLPRPEPGEKIEDYYERANVEFQREKIHHRNDVVKLTQAVKEARADKLNMAAEHYLNEEKLGKEIVKLAREMEVPQLDDHMVREIRRDVKQMRDFRQAVEDYPDKKETEQLMNSFNKMVAWQREQERKKKRKISSEKSEY